MVKWSNENFHAGYDRIVNEFPNVKFMIERNAKEQFYEFLNNYKNSQVGLFTDDCVFYRETQTNEFEINKFLSDESVNCFTFRLGLNTTLQDYVTNKRVDLPKNYEIIDNKFMKWNWRQYTHKHDSNFGFPNAFDSHIYQAEYLLWLSDGGHFDGILYFEGMICNNGRDALHSKDYMVSPLHSEVFVQQINSTHNLGLHTNHTWNVSKEELNQRYVDGQIISLESMDVSNIQGAHNEVRFDYD